MSKKLTKDEVREYLKKDHTKAAETFLVAEGFTDEAEKRVVQNLAERWHDALHVAAELFEDAYVTTFDFPAVGLENVTCEHKPAKQKYTIH